MRSKLMKMGALGLASVLATQSIGAGTVFAKSSNFDLI